MYIISKEFSFDAAHHLLGLPPEHPCSRVHGHTYTVIIELASIKLNEVGFVVDYRKLSIVKDFIDSALDHKDLNDFLPMNPTAENIAKYLYDLFKERIPQLSSVSVKETPKTIAKYSPNFD